MIIDEFFTLIRDGAWHSIDRLADQLGIQTPKITEFSQFLSEQGLLNYEDKTRRIQIKPFWRFLLPEEEPLQVNAIVARLVIPPETSIDVQSTHISNLSNIELDISLRINSRIKEVAIKI